MNNMFKYILTSILMGLALVSSICLAKTPRMNLEFSFRQVESGKTSSSFFPTTLTCSNKGQCVWVSVAMNQCFGDDFYPKIEVNTTESGTLRLKELKKDVWQVMLINDNTLSFVVSVSCTGVGESRSCDKVTDLNGSLTKYSEILKRSISVEYIRVLPSPGKVALDCKNVIYP